MSCKNHDIGGYSFLLTNFDSTSAIFNILYLALNKYIFLLDWEGNTGKYSI